MLMSIYDKVIYYCGLVGLVIVLGFIIGMVVGAVDTSPSTIGKLAVSFIVGVGLFLRGYRAKQATKVQDVLNRLQKTEKHS